MKRILAIIMVLAMVFAFAACKPKDDGKDTTAPGVSGDAVTNDNNESVPADASDEEIKEIALADETFARILGDKQVVKCIVVKGRLINFIVK